MSKPTDTIVITAAGLAEIINAEHNGTAPVLIKEIGYGTGQYTATDSQTALKKEFKRLSSLSGGAVGDQTIHVTALDASADSYTVYEIGLFTDKGTLFAVYSQTVPILQKASQSQSLLAVDIIASAFDATSIVFGDTNFHNPPATTSTLGVVELATDAEVLSGADASRVVTPATLSKRVATTGRTGLIKLATSAEVAAGKDNTKAVTPLALLSAFQKSHEDSGYQRLPNGLIIQWGKGLVARDGSTKLLFPVAFPKKCSVVLAESTETLSLAVSVKSRTRGNFDLVHDGNGGANVAWLAVGF